MKPSIFIALPTYREQMDADTTVSLMNLVHYLTVKGIPHGTGKLDHGNITEARNFLASWFLHTTELTHLFFSDNDVSFKPHVAQQMLARQADVVGCIVPERNSNPPKPNADGIYKREDGALLCKRIGTGIMLISRNALHKLTGNATTSRPAKSFKIRHTYDGPVHGFFDPLQVNGEELSEDYSFCERWRSIGGEVHAVADASVGHAGRSVIRAATGHT